jgi:hypothetical protein
VSIGGGQVCVGEGHSHCCMPLFERFFISGQPLFLRGALLSLSRELIPHHTKEAHNASPCTLTTPVNGNVRTVGVKNELPRGIMDQVVHLRGSAGRKATLQVKQRLRTDTPSIQGPWTPELQDQLRQQA